MSDKAATPATGAGELRRSVGLLGLVLYGVGLTIGAGIYVLVGETVLRAGIYAPAAFLLSSIAMAFTAGTFAELSSRVPKAAGEAVYVEAAFGIPALTILVGLAILVEAVIAAAAIAVGAAGYIGELVALPREVLVALVVLSMATVAAWGIRESIAVAGAMTVVEVLGLVIIVVAGLWSDPGALVDLPASLAPPLSDSVAISGVIGASMIAFFAFIGFDDIVNLVEETRNPKKTLPIAIGITLVLVTTLYILVSFVALRAIPAAELGASDAPISLLFERLTGLPSLAITLVAILATTNGVMIILIMAARVTYGMAREGRLPRWLGEVSPRTQTPLVATGIVAALILALALLVPLEALAETSSEVLLGVFVLVNLALVALKLGEDAAPSDSFEVPILIPVLGALASIGLLTGSMIVA